jgi:fido (protein-threonine AMPylation protein)
VAGDPYVYPGTDVLRNKLGIRNAAQLTVVETDLHDLRAAQLAERPEQCPPCTAAPSFQE